MQTNAKQCKIQCNAMPCVMSVSVALQHSSALCRCCAAESSADAAAGAKLCTVVQLLSMQSLQTSLLHFCPDLKLYCGTNTICIEDKYILSKCNISPISQTVLHHIAQHVDHIATYHSNISKQFASVAIYLQVATILDVHDTGIL